MDDENRFSLMRDPVAGIIIPGCQAFITSLAGGWLVGAVALWRRADDSMAIGLAAGALTFVLAWLGALAFWRKAIFGPPAGMPASQDELPDLAPNYLASVQPAPVRVELVSNNGNWVDWMDLQLERDKLVSVARKLASGRASFGLAELGGRGKILSRAEFEILRDEFIQRGLACWVSPHAHNRGCNLTAAGRAVVRRIASLGDDTPPPGDYLPLG